jgi:hypothetical protein
LRRSLRTIFLVCAVGLAAARCGIPGAARASDSWTHTYPITGRGEIAVTNTNGRIDVEGVDATAVEVTAERIAHGATEQLARDILPRITITEDVRPDFISIRSERIEGLLIAAGFEVRYHVKAPRSIVVHATTTNGGVSLRGTAGRVVAQTTNGGISATDLRGGINARATNGGVRVELSSVGADSVSLTTVNGGVRLALPASAKATVTASWVNGGFSTSGLQFDIVDQSRRHFEGRLNGGGATIDLRTTNGGVTISSP